MIKLPDNHKVVGRFGIFLSQHYQNSCSRNHVTWEGINLLYVDQAKSEHQDLNRGPYGGGQKYDYPSIMD